MTLTQTLPPKHSAKRGRALLSSVATLVTLFALCGCAGMDGFAQYSQRVEARLQRAEAEGFRGVIMVSRGGSLQGILATGSKYQGDLGEPITLLDTVRLASITKQVTAVMVMQEVERGTLKLDDEAARYLSELPRGVTVRMLMNHTSGLQNSDKVSGFYELQGVSAATLAARSLKSCAQAVAAPGQRFEYNNCDFIVLGALLERINAQPLEALFQARVAKPAGMVLSGFYAPGQDISTHVRGAELINGKRSYDTPLNPAAYGAAGGMYTVVFDVWAFSKAFVADKLISAQSRAELTRANSAGAALGMWSYPIEIEGKRLQAVDRQGWIGGVRWLHLTVPQTQQIVIILSTQSELELGRGFEGKGLGVELLQAMQ